MAGVMDGRVCVLGAQVEAAQRGRRISCYTERQGSVKMAEE